MNVISEKVIYETEVYEKFANIDAEGILWGEDLYDTKMVVFSGKIKSIRGLYKRDLIKVAIVYFDFRQVLYIKSMAVKFNCNTQTSYIEKEQFNIMWKHLRKSVELGIRLHRENGEHVPINIPEDIVDLSLLQRKGRLAKIKNGKIIYTAAEISKETKKAQGRKQSLLDNREYNFFYDVNENIFHDRDCEAIKYITPDNFMAETKIPEGLKPCRKCRRQMCLRKACEPSVKQIPCVNRLLAQSGINDASLEKYVFRYNLMFRVLGPNELSIKSKEDTWIIKGFDNSKLSLWHNNYVKTSPTKRYITQGFHDQKIRSRNIYVLFEYVINYTYEKHLEAERMSEEKEKDTAEQKCSQQKGQGLLARIKSFITRLVHGSY